MTILQNLFEALESLNGNKLRSGLTILGIVIGVGAVIAMLALGAGAQDTITSSISGIGTNLLFVFRGNSENANVRNPRPLTLADAQALADPFEEWGAISVTLEDAGVAAVFVHGRTREQGGQDHDTQHHHGDVAGLHCIAQTHQHPMVHAFSPV